MAQSWYYFCDCCGRIQNGGNLHKLVGNDPQGVKQAVLEALAGYPLHHVVTALGCSTPDVSLLDDQDAVAKTKETYDAVFFPNLTAAHTFLPLVKSVQGSTFTVAGGPFTHHCPDPQLLTVSLMGATLNHFGTILNALTKDTPCRANTICCHYAIAYPSDTTSKFGPLLDQDFGPVTDARDWGKAFVRVAQGTERLGFICMHDAPETAVLVASKEWVWFPQAWSKSIRSENLGVHCRVDTLQSNTILDIMWAIGLSIIASVIIPNHNSSHLLLSNQHFTMCRVLSPVAIARSVRAAQTAALLAAERQLTARLRQELVVSNIVAAHGSRRIVIYQNTIVLFLVVYTCIMFYGALVIAQGREELYKFQMDSWDVYREMIGEVRQRENDIWDLHFHFFEINLVAEAPEGRNKHILQEGMEASKKATERANQAENRLTDLWYAHLVGRPSTFSPSSSSEDDSQAVDDLTDLSYANVGVAASSTILPTSVSEEDSQEVDKLPDVWWMETSSTFPPSALSEDDFLHSL